MAIIFEPSIPTYYSQIVHLSIVFLSHSKTVSIASAADSSSHGFYCDLLFSFSLFTIYFSSQPELLIPPEKKIPQALIRKYLRKEMIQLEKHQAIDICYYVRESGLEIRNSIYFLTDPDCRQCKAMEWNVIVSNCVLLSINLPVLENGVQEFTASHNGGKERLISRRISRCFCLLFITPTIIFKNHSHT